MKKHPFDKLQLKNGGTFILTPCPGTKDVELKLTISQLKEAGAKAIISVMFDEEMSKLNASLLPTYCNELNVKWFQLPILDDDAPRDDFEKAFNTNLEQILNMLNNQESIAVHCKGGSGRTGLVIGLLMLKLGYVKEDIIKQVQQVRNKSLKHPIQFSYFNNFKA
jgi:protein-tyrosine phosphatase